MSKQTHCDLFFLDVLEILFLDGDELEQIEKDGVNLFYILLVCIFYNLEILFDSDCQLILLFVVELLKFSILRIEWVVTIDNVLVHILAFLF